MQFPKDLKTLHLTIVMAMYGSGPRTNSETFYTWRYLWIYFLTQHLSATLI